MKIKFLAALILLMSFMSPQTFAEVLSSTAKDQKEIEVTVYNSNIALVKDLRRVNLPKGEGELRFMDVAAHIIPETVHARSLNFVKKFSVLEQNYEYDLMDYGKLMDKYIGEEIKLEVRNPYQDRVDMKKATLLSNNNNQPVYQIDGEIYLGYGGRQILPKIPETLIAKPTLTWMYQNAVSKEHDLEVSYLTNQMNWKADYVLVLDEGDISSDLSGWVTLDNRSGTEYEDVKLKLVSGDIHRVQSGYQQTAYLAREYSVDQINSAKQFSEESFFEYHIYDLQRPTTLKNNQTKQISLLDATSIPVKKEFIVQGQRNYYRSQYAGKLPDLPVEVYVKLKNAKDHGLGMPLPKGIVRLYKEDSKGKIQFIGEDRIDHIPKDEEIDLKVGDAFDVVAERRQTDYNKITSRIYETAWEVTLRNHKEDAIVVNLREPLYGDWQILNSSHKYDKKKAFLAEFMVPVKADEEVKVTYRVRVTY